MLINHECLFIYYYEAQTWGNILENFIAIDGQWLILMDTNDKTWEQINPPVKWVNTATATTCLQIFRVQLTNVRDVYRTKLKIVANLHFNQQNCQHKYLAIVHYNTIQLKIG